MRKYILILIGIVFIINVGYSQTVYYVSNNGSDKHTGTPKKPFATIRKALEIMKPGDVCRVRGGVYRETVHVKQSGYTGKPIRIESYNGEKVILDGTNEVKSSWKKWKKNIYKTKMPEVFEQLFQDREMMTEARWPNCNMPDQLWDRSTWATSGEGSRYGKMVDARLAETDVDWTGAIAVLNVAHQFRSWSRKVLKHDKHANSFTYKKNLKPITSYANKTKEWEDDLYYLTGKLEALDAPNEWFLDKKTKLLYVYTTGDVKNNIYRYKCRDFGLVASKMSHIEIVGLCFFGSTIKLSNCNNCLVENCRFEYPAYNREFNDPEVPANTVDTYVRGNNNRILNNYISYSQGNGMVIQGGNNHVENNIIHDVAWTGQGFGIQLYSTGKEGFLVTKNTIYNTGYSGMRLDGEGGWTASYNHVHHTALISKDCAAIQTGNWRIKGSVIHHNWVHDCFTVGKHQAGLYGGLGIRGDDQTRGLTVHHNVVWNCGRDGIIVKGDRNMVYNNTVFAIGSNEKEGNYISMHTMPEPHKPWLKQAPLLTVQNENSLIFNNLAFNIVGDRKKTAYQYLSNLSTNYNEKILPLVDPENFNFSPIEGSSIIDAGTYLQGYTDNFNGILPDIGAYEFGDTWKAGADWDPYCDPQGN
ncbi:hypothetical protein EYV94_00080 [Puteibacter caeruleilacunae]|nr:hypothetical protein EYV94_00080 [Puteibacter caeruleilacunae]